MMHDIVSGFLTYITVYPQAYGYLPDPSQPTPQAVPLPLALSRLLYIFCKVRGYKVIVRLLNNEPRYVEPMLSAVRNWETVRPPSGLSSNVWEEKYIMLLWLSHLMLAPFELSTLSTTNDGFSNAALQSLSHGLPDVAVDVLHLGFQNLTSPSKERESAVILLVRLALRRDMQLLGLAGKLVDHAVHALVEAPQERTASVYPAIGHLSLLYALMNLGTDTEVAPFLKKAFQATSVLLTSPLDRHASIRGSAPARKLLIKLTRVCLTHAVALMDTASNLDSDSVNTMLEEGIQNYLDALGDKDSPVRLAASKALSIVALKLNNDMAAEIVEAILASLSEDILVEDPTTNRLMAKTERPDDETAQMRRNVSAVDPLKWHGLMLTLGHLLFRRSPPSHLLADIVEALILGLEFEQRSNVGTSIGNGVRDAACFGIWALSRKYATKELEPIKRAHVAGMGDSTVDEAHSVLQLIAVRLILSACFDPSGNIRRGSSAALQELIGRHPDTIIMGIPVVQVVDYQAVARRSRAMMQVAVDVAGLDPVYHDALLRALLDWRGARAADADSRRWASVAVLKLNATTTILMKETLLGKMANEVQALKAKNLGTTAGARHGLLLSMASAIRSISAIDSSEHSKPRQLLTTLPLSAITGDLEGRMNNDMELVIEAVGSFVQALAESLSADSENLQTSTASAMQAMLGIINHSTVMCNKPKATEACAGAASELFQKLDSQGQTHLLDSWLTTASQKRSDLVCKGRLTALAHIHCLAKSHPSSQAKIVTFFASIITNSTIDAIETRTTAMDALTTLLQRHSSTSPPSPVNLPALQSALFAGLNDYTNDQRGDIGSLLRLSSLDAVEVFCALRSPRDVLHNEAEQINLVTHLSPTIVRLAAEKLNKVRHRAWRCLRLCSEMLMDQQPPPLLHPEAVSTAFEHLSDVSTQGYFAALMPLLQSPSRAVRRQLMLGLASSAAGTTEEIGRACCAAVVSFRMRRGREEARRVGREVVVTVLAVLKGDGEGEPMNDHQVIPMLDFLTFLLEQDFLPMAILQPGDEDAMWNAVQKFHLPVSSMERVEALIRLYYAFLTYPTLRSRTLDKLTRLLLHRYPKVRNAAADTLYLESGNERLVQADWNAAAATNKPAVLELRRTLGVAKLGAQKAAA